MLEDRAAQHDKQVVDKFHNPEADYEMTTRDYIVRPSADDDSGAITITLPPVAEAKGRFYSILIRDADGTNTVTVEDNNDDSENWAADIPFDGPNEGAVFYSDGLKWAITPLGIRGVSFTSARTDAGTVIRCDVAQLILTGASATNMAEAVRYSLFSNVRVGAWANAIVGVIDFSTAGYVTGLAGVVCAELDMPGGAVPGGSGTYWLFEGELNLPTSYVGGGVPLALMGLNVWGAEKAQFDSAGFLFDITGVTSGDGDFFYDHTANAADGFLKCRINGATYYIVLSDDTAFA